MSLKILGYFQLVGVLFSILSLVHTGIIQFEAFRGTSALLCINKGNDVISVEEILLAGTTLCLIAIYKIITLTFTILVLEAHASFVIFARMVPFFISV